MSKKTEEQKKRYAETRKKKYKEDAEYRASVLAKCNEYREANKDKVTESNKASGKKYRDSNKDKRKVYRESIAEENKIYQKNYRKANKEKRKLTHLKRIEEDLVYAISVKVRSLISKRIKSGGFTKKSQAHEILGCSYDEFKAYLESKFEPWMTWDNRGLYNGKFNYGWDIDHIIPLCSAKTEEELLKLLHYTNCQPLCSKINRDIKKGVV